MLLGDNVQANDVALAISQFVSNPFNESVFKLKSVEPGHDESYYEKISASYGNSETLSFLKSSDCAHIES